MFWQVMTASRCSFATPVPWRHRACLVPLQDVSTRFRYFLVRWSIHFILLHWRMWFPTQDISCVIRSSRMASMSWKALLAARHCVATPVLLSRRENRSGAMTLFHCFTIGLSIDIFISYHNRYFNIVIFNIRVSIRVRGLHLVFFPSPLPFGGSTVLSLTRGPAGNRTTTGRVSATQECPHTNFTTRTTHETWTLVYFVDELTWGCHKGAVRRLHLEEDFRCEADGQRMSVELDMDRMGSKFDLEGCQLRGSTWLRMTENDLQTRLAKARLRPSEAHYDLRPFKVTPTTLKPAGSYEPHRPT